MVSVLGGNTLPVFVRFCFLVNEMCTLGNPERLVNLPGVWKQWKCPLAKASPSPRRWFIRKHEMGLVLLKSPGGRWSGKRDQELQVCVNKWAMGKSSSVGFLYKLWLLWHYSLLFLCAVTSLCPPWLSFSPSYSPIPLILSRGLVAEMWRSNCPYGQPETFCNGW